MDKDQSAIVLANKIRDCIIIHMRNFDVSKEYPEMIGSAIIALYLETARLKWLSCSTGDVEPEIFDKVFNEGVEKHYDDHKVKYGNC